MGKKRVSSIDLNWKIFEQLRDETDEPFGLSIAVIPDGGSNWRVVVEKRSARRMDPVFMRRLAAVEKSLQAKYALQPD